jgi:tetratricopeptide (TPR) repeat protein
MLACVTAALIGGSILFYFWQSRLADRRVEQVETLADSAISDMTEKLQESPVSVETQAALFHSALQYLNQLRQSSGNDPHVLLQLSRAYKCVGDLEGSPFAANLGNSETAFHSYQEALRLTNEAHSLLPGEESTRTLIEAYQRLDGMEYSWVSLENLQRATDHYRQCLPLARDFWRQNPADPIRRDLLAANYIGLADIEEVSREPDKALMDFRSALQILGGDLTGDEEHDIRLPSLYSLIGRQLHRLGDQAEALVNNRKAVTIAEALAAGPHPSRRAQRLLVIVYDDMIDPLGGEEMLNVGDYQQAQAYARKALAVAEGLAASDSKDALARSDLGFAYLDGKCLPFNATGNGGRLVPKIHLNSRRS